MDKSTMQGIEELPRDALIRVLSLTEGDEERCGSSLSQPLGIVYIVPAGASSRCKPPGHQPADSALQLSAGDLRRHANARHSD